MRTFFGMEAATIDLEAIARFCTLAAVRHDASGLACVFLAIGMEARQHVRRIKAQARSEPCIEIPLASVWLPVRRA